MGEWTVVYQVARVAPCCGGVDALETCHTWKEAAELADTYPLDPDHEVEVRPRIGLRVGSEVYLLPGECEVVPARDEEAPEFPSS